MWNFLAREANWTEIVTNTLALSFSFMAIAIIIHAAIFSDNPDMLATAGSVSSGVTGVILGYYFNRSRLKRAQDAESRASDDLSEALRNVDRAQRELLERRAEYDRLIEQMADHDEEIEGEDGSV